MQRLEQKLTESWNNGTFEKAVLSGSRDKNIKKKVYTASDKNGDRQIKEEIFLADGKALHAFYSGDELPGLITGAESFKQTDIFCHDFSAVVLRSKNGGVHIKYGTQSAVVKVGDGKNYILSPDKKYDFLTALDIQDSSGRVHDKRQSKFRQINRFLQIVGDIRKKLPEDNIVVWDLCCGKSYLSFAVYYYFRYILDRNIDIYCVDRKSDVIKECSCIAESIGFDRMHFISGDIFKCLPENHPHLVLSLHACDTATDMVLSEAVKRGADVILSSPCCQHELASQMKAPKDDIMMTQPIFKQKFAALLTDALRCRLLYACGYKTAAVEFIDPDDTPKNLLIRAEKTVIPVKLKQRELYLYDKTCEEYDLHPTMRRLLSGYFSFEENKEQYKETNKT